MEFLVYEWFEDGLDGGSEERYTHHEGLDDAVDYADRRAEFYDAMGWEHNVLIYEVTKY